MASDPTSSATRTVPIGTIALLVVAGVLYVGMLSTLRSSASGDAVVGAAMEWLFFTALLWVVLTILLLVGGLMGRMPRLAAGAAIVLQPLAGAALLVSGDFYSRHRNLPPVEPALLPLLIAFYALWARLPALHRRLTPTRTSVAVWGLVFVLSVGSLVVASYY
ncbi:MAG TPA: hypothetical protein VET89_03470 [Stellaceae bacterium]|nr:hypothetical protein [Stellaceae bacterium]